METRAKSSTSTPLLEIEGLVSGYGKTTILHGVDLKILQGEIVALVGPNGAGKSTLVNSVSGFTTLKGGTIKFQGQRIDGWKPERISTSGLVQCPEGRRIFQRMTIEENLRVVESRKGASVRDLETRVFDLFPILRERRGALASSLSGGQQQMLAIGRALMAAPDLLMLDEPSLGLAPKIVNQIMEMIIRLADQGMTILLIEQHARFALGISDFCYGLENGRVALRGPSAKAEADERVRSLYLAVTEEGGEATA